MIGKSVRKAPHRALKTLLSVMQMLIQCKHAVLAQNYSRNVDMHQFSQGECVLHGCPLSFCCLSGVGIQAWCECKPHPLWWWVAFDGDPLLTTLDHTGITRGGPALSRMVSEDEGTMATAGMSMTLLVASLPLSPFSQCFYYFLLFFYH